MRCLNRNTLKNIIQVQIFQLLLQKSEIFGIFKIHVVIYDNACNMVKGVKEIGF